MKIVIIGNGVAGTNAARHIRKRSDHDIVMISDETLRPYSRTALMYVYMGHVKQENTELYEDWFWAKNRIKRVLGRVASLDTTAKNVVLTDGTVMSYDRLVIATGSKSNKFGWPGQDLKAVQGLYHLQDLQSMELYSKGLKRAVIVGGGLIGIEMAEMFLSRGIAVTCLVREASFWDNVLPPEESAMINRHILAHHIDLRLSTELQEILSDADGRASAVVTNYGERIDCAFVGLTVGVSPNIDFLKGSGVETQRGVLVDEYLQTNVKDIYAIGDCAQLRSPQPSRRPIEAIWYTGRMMGQTVAHTICGVDTRYRPKLWFNSAKFLDIEYQVYGDVPNTVPEHIQTLYWEHPREHKAIRINYEKETKRVTGFNLMGIRYRHEVCEKWLTDATSITQVLQDLSLANFDPEFFSAYEQALVSLYNQASGENLTLRKVGKLSFIQRFLKS